VKYTIPLSAGDAVCRLFSPTFSVSQLAHPNGVWVRQYVLITPTDGLSIAGDRVNCKVHLCRSNAGGSKDGLILFAAGGGGFPATKWGWATDWDTGTTAEAALDNFSDGVWREFLFHYGWNTVSSQGFVDLWINGLHQSAARITNANAFSAATDYQQDVGLSFLSGASGDMNVYSADMGGWEGCPDPQVTS
jgi:hypothetical protein